MNRQPGFLILVVVAVAFGGIYLFSQMVAGCISVLSVGLGCGPDFAVVGGFFLAIAIAVIALARKDNK